MSLKKEYNITTNDFNSFIKDFRGLGEDINQALYESIKETVNEIVTDLSSKKYRGIKAKELVRNNGRIQGGYSDELQSDIFQEFGTGLHSTEGHIGTSPTFQKTDGMYWYVPVDKAERLTKYNYEVVTNKNGEQFYKVYGQKAKLLFSNSVDTAKRKIADKFKNKLTLVK